MGGRQREAGRGSGPKIVSVGVGSARRGDRRDLHHPHPETNHPPPRYGEPKGSNNRRGDIWIGVRPPPITATENTLTADFTKEDPTIWTGRCSNSRRRRLACDVQVCRLPTGPLSEILDLGRTRRTVSAAQWRALRHRDRHCRFPGCRRPTTWCDAHHLISWWEHQGPTDLDNLILLCRHHHTLIHRRGWKLTGTATHPTFTRPDGTTLPNGPPPRTQRRVPVAG